MGALRVERSPLARVPLAEGLVLVETVVAGMSSPSRRRAEERRAGRSLLREALCRLGGGGKVGRGPAGEPRLPEGFFGSVAHAGGRVLAAVGRGASDRAVGVDLEPARPLPERLARRLLHADERTVARLPWLLWTFCAKEALYKAQFTRTERFLGLRDVVVRFGEGGRFRCEAPGAPPAVARVIALAQGVVRQEGGFVRALVRLDPS